MVSFRIYYYFQQMMLLCSGNILKREMIENSSPYTYMLSCKQLFSERCDYYSNAGYLTLELNLLHLQIVLILFRYLPVFKKRLSHTDTKLEICFVLRIVERGKQQHQMQIQQLLFQEVLMHSALPV